MSAISDYFRTALLIDDRVAADFRTLERLGGEHSSELAAEPAPGLVAPPEEDETPVQPAQLARAFLASDVVCSVLEATDSGTVLEEQVLQGAQIADLLIIDWLIDGDDSATIGAIEAVATQFPERLTVIVVFTGAHSLSGVVQRLLDAAEFEPADDYIVRRNNTVVLVFGKPGPPLTGGEDRRQPDVEYMQLPRMIRDDLEMVFKGLMPEFAFSGINALRESAPRILATFNAELDAGALIHRALLPEPSDAADQFVRLLASDFEQVLHDRGVGDIWHIDASLERLARVTSSGDALRLATRLRRSPRVADDLKRLEDDQLVCQAISSGLTGIGLGDSSVTEASADLAAAMPDAGSSSESLAVLIDTSGLGAAPPRLELGIVLACQPTAEEARQAGHDVDQHLWLCVQPLCDSVRLRDSRTFPLVPVLADADPPKAMICHSDGSPSGISFVTHLHQLRQVRFSPSNAGAVVAQGGAPNWYFTDEDDVRYDVVARLRPNLAAQVAQALGSAATRIGTDQSEWFRRRART